MALRQRETLATLRVRDGVLVLETMLWPDEVRNPDFAFLDEDIDGQGRRSSRWRSPSSTRCRGSSTPTQYTDAYREALESLIEAKVEGQEVVEPPGEAPTAGSVVDLMAALRASVEAAKKDRKATG